MNVNKPEQSFQLANAHEFIGREMALTSWLHLDQIQTNVFGVDCLGGARKGGPLAGADSTWCCATLLGAIVKFYGRVINDFQGAAAESIRLKVHVINNVSAEGHRVRCSKYRGIHNA